MQKVYEQPGTGPTQKVGGDGVEIKMYDNSATSPFKQFKKQTFDQALAQQEMRKAKNVMTATLHQKG